MAKSTFLRLLFHLWVTVTDVSSNRQLYRLANGRAIFGKIGKQLGGLLLRLEKQLGGGFNWALVGVFEHYTCRHVAAGFLGFFGQHSLSM